jgi:hypothetical protein
MVRAAAVIAAAVAVLMLACTVAQAQVILWSDDFEHYSGNWTTSPGCTSPHCVSTASYPNCNHTPGGSHGLSFADDSDAVYHDMAYEFLAGPVVKLTCWFYDSLDGDLSALQIRDPDTTDLVGIGAYGADYASVVVRSGQGGTWGPTNIFDSGIQRTLGWHRYDIVRYNVDNAGDMNFYVDGILAHHATDIFDPDLNRIYLGNGNLWGGSLSECYIDDVSLTVPEPSCLPALGAGLVALVGFANRRRRA